MTEQMFIVIEGIEGSGKSTLCRSLAQRLRSEGQDVLETREPGGTAVGDAVREVFLDRSLAISPVTESLLVNAARAQHVLDLIRPALAEGKIVLCDRFVDSTLAYQGYGRGLNVESLRHVCATATGGLQPDLVLLLDVAVEAARDRLRERMGRADRIEAESDDFHQRVRRGFLALARDSDTHRVFDATLPPARLVEAAMAEVRLRLGVPVR